MKKLIIIVGIIVVSVGVGLIGMLFIMSNIYSAQETTQDTKSFTQEIQDWEKPQPNTTNTTNTATNTKVVTKPDTRNGGKVPINTNNTNNTNNSISKLVAYPSMGQAPLTVTFSDIGQTDMSYGDGTSCGGEIPYFEGPPPCGYGPEGRKEMFTHTYTSPGRFVVKAMASLPSRLLGYTIVVVTGEK